MGILHWCLSRYSSVWCQSHESIHQSEIQFEVTNKGHIDEYLGLKVDSRHDRSMKLYRGLSMPSKKVRSSCWSTSFMLDMDWSEPMYSQSLAVSLCHWLHSRIALSAAMSTVGVSPWLLASSTINPWTSDSSCTLSVSVASLFYWVSSFPLTRLMETCSVDCGSLLGVASANTKLLDGLICSSVWLAWLTDG